MKKFGLFLLAMVLIAAGALFYALSPAVQAIDFPEHQTFNFLEWQQPKNPYPKRLKVVTYNIGYASGDKNNLGLPVSQPELDQNLSALTKVLQELDGDILALQEVDFDSNRSLRVDQLKYLARELQMPYAAYVLTWNLKYLPWPYWPPSRHYGRVVSGQAVLSRYPIVAQKIIPYEKPKANPFWYNWFYLERRVQQLAIQVGSQSIVFWNVHLEPFDSATRLEQAEKLGREVAGLGAPLKIAAGDFNSVTFIKPEAASEAEDRGQAVQVFLKETSLSDTHPQGEAAKEYFTMPSWKPIKKIDHIFYSGGLKLDAAGQASVGPGSDHLPVWAEFSLP